MLKQALIYVLIAMTLSACLKSAESTLPTPLPDPTPTQAFIPTQAVIATLPAAAPTSSASVSPTPFAPFTVNPAVDNLKVRVNPGLLFEALILVQTTDTLTVQGVAPGGEWAYIQTQDGTEGWVFTQLLQSEVDLGQAPVRQPEDVLLIKGKVVDASGTPIQGVGFEIAQSSGGAVSTNNVNTDASGMFYSFLPDTASGTWTITYTAIACESNVWSDATCSTYKTGYTGNVDPASQTLDLPQGDNPVSFLWK